MFKWFTNSSWCPDPASETLTWKQFTVVFMGIYLMFEAVWWGGMGLMYLAGWYDK